MCSRLRGSSTLIATVALFIFITISFSDKLEAQESSSVENEQPVIKIPKAPPPSPIATASYLSLDGLTLVIVFDKPVNLSASIESVENRWGPQTNHTSLHWAENAVVHSALTSPVNQSPTCQLYSRPKQGQYLDSKHLIQGIQLCARLLSKKTLKILHKHKLRNCIWASRVQFIVQLSRPAASGALRISFQRNTISEHGQTEAQRNEREIALELSKLPLEGLGVPLTPRLALTGPNQVSVCGHFVLSAHLSSPFGTLPGDSVKLTWSVERYGSFNQNASDTQAIASSELKWKTLQMLVNSNKANNLILDSELLQFSPQIYKFRLNALYSTSLSSVSLNATHQVTRIDFDAPIGTIYGSHLLDQDLQVNTNQDLVLLADIQVPSCANNIKQVGLYWQVSDARVKFEQTYSPYYLAKANTLPEQSMIEFRLNAFYGIRVKKFASTHTLVTTGDSVLDSSISDGQLIVSINQQEPSEKQLELYGSLKAPEQDKYAYQWSCFDGKTAQACFKSLRSLPNNGTRYEIGALQAIRPLDAPATPANQLSGVTLVDRQNHRQSVLKIPLSWLDHDAQLWFGLQRSDRLNPGQPSKTEYTLVSVQSNQTGPTISIGPVLISQSRQRATLRNPLTGAMILVANTPAIIIGRLGPSRNVNSFSWQSPNQIQPLHWTIKNTTNPLTGGEEILTELHLNPRQQVAYGHQQIQLVACSDSGARVKASLNLDIVQGVSQCRVEVSQSMVLNSLVISVNYCNIPLGLSPITYQIYMIDTSSLESPLETSNRPSDTSVDDDYINESDEEFFEDLAQPLSMPQLTPILSLPGFNALNLLALAANGTRPGVAGGEEGQQQVIKLVSVRFAARVCNRLQSCQMFYSAPVNARSLLAKEMQNSTTNNLNGQLGNNNRSLPLTELLAQQDSSRSLLAIIDSIQGMIDSAKRANLAGNSIAALSILNSAIDLNQRVMTSSDSMDNFQLNRAKNLLLVAMRDSLQYGAISIQRQFHYTDSGQTNLMIQTMSRIVASPTGGVDLKFKAMRLITMLTRRSIQEQLALKVNCLAEPKFIQAGYESLFGAFSHYSLEPGDKYSHGNHSLKYPALVSSLTVAISNTSAINAPPSPAALQGTIPAPTASSSKKRREEAILAYLKSVRLAYRSLLSAAAIQLPLGDSQQFRYFSEPHNSNGAAESSSVKLVSSASSGSEIVSSVTHLTELPMKPLVTDLGELGSISVSLDERLLSKVKANALDQGPRLRCRNDTVTKCSSLVVALTTFTGKSPFRSLDHTTSLRVPQLEINLLSPVDGSNIVDLMPDGNEFKTSVMFAFPRPAPTEEFSTSDRPYKCYQFDEDTNEWSQSAENQSSGEFVVDGSPQDQTRSSLKCVFNGLGTFGAFQGKPPPDEASMRSAIIAAVSVLAVVIILFIVLGCLASNSRSKRAQGSESSIDGGDSPESKRHPEQTYRRGFNNYPL